MKEIEKEQAPTADEIQTFLSNIDFPLPKGFIEFFSESNGGYVTTDDRFLSLWPLTEMIQLNKDYSTELFAPDFFVFGSDGGDIAYVIHKADLFIYDMPFIGMSREEATFVASDFVEFLDQFD